MLSQSKLLPLSGFVCVLHETGINIADSSAGKSEGILAQKMMEVVIHKFPVERQVIRYNTGRPFERSSSH